MYKTIGILAHVDAGKTTFCEQLLYNTKVIKERGRVDHKNSFLDNNNIEKKRGITVFSNEATFYYNDSTYYLVDTPGHVDFSTEMERAVQVMDYAVVIVSAVEGVQGHTETVCELLKQYKVPTFFFINKEDRDGANVLKVINKIREVCGGEVIYLNNSLKEPLDCELIEEIGAKDENLLELYLEDNYEKNLWVNFIKDETKKCNIHPCMSGSALYNKGIKEFMENIDILTYSEFLVDKDFVGRVYKVRHDDDGTKITYIKALQGSLKIKDELKYINADNDKIYEKVNQIRIYNGEKFKTVDKAVAGEIFAVVGPKGLLPGDGVGEVLKKTNFKMIPTLTSKVIYDKSLDEREVLKYFRILECEDPNLMIVYNEKLKEIQTHIMGYIQLEILKEVLKERFNIEVEFGDCEILYKETVESTAIGYGHFEPLGHYAEIHLKIEKGERGSGIEFKNTCHADDLTIGNQNLVKTHIYEKKHKGILTGSEITDLKVTLLTGRAHNKHTSGGDFREATLRALRYALEDAHCILLEPYYRFKIEISLEHTGRVISDVQKLNGNFQLKSTSIESNIITGRIPVATFMNYPKEFISYTKGRGRISLAFDGYDVCHNSEEVIKKINYNKNSDGEYTSSSIFCSKGQGFTVRGEEIKQYIHCSIN
ncbi:TetM/TetW/TetO/TetS family tetracycline resistance ribosomal protection protein [Clostridium sp. ATCC 25772]|uniref:elongation factor G n=1 Tax=Clostridium sp. ATCC 25772 TaxID=1676991 RepID=UPI000785E939|nr:TetM/TetW/TetO/TetS family tetracycline resistance ribosomal protection protein [Clostridium sp. ATCC 25772]